MKLNKLTNTEAAYIAGFLDGEGSIYGKTVKITQAEPQQEVLYWIKDTVGAGCVDLHRTKTDKWNNCYRYRIQSKKMGREFLSQLLPYLIVKKEKALLF